MPYTFSTLGEHSLKNEEGLRLVAYYCPAGKLTIGWGTRLYAGTPSVITIEQAQAFLDAAVGRILKDLWVANKTLNQNEVDALVSFIYNIGLGAWGGSHARINLVANKVNNIPREMIRWVHDDHGFVIPGLVTRRKGEIAIFNGENHA